MKRIRRWLFILSLTLGFTGTCAFAGYMPEYQNPEPVTQLAWWGELYPEFCMPGAMEAAGGGRQDEDTEQAGWNSGKIEIPVKIRFKYLTFLNDRGE